jgi:putative endonuclease
VYILYSAQLDKYYVGSTEDVLSRLRRHNMGHSTYTKTGIPWVLKYEESIESRDKGYRREFEISHLLHKKKAHFNKNVPFNI